MFITKKLRVALLLALFTLTVGTIGAGQAEAWTEVAPFTTADIITATNNERVAEELAPLTISAELTAAAQMKAWDMVGNSYFAHYSPTGITPWYWVSLTGYNYVNAGENLARGFKTTETLVDAWMNSPTHNANIVGAQYTETGIALAQTVQDNRSVWIVVQMFGSR